MWIHSCVLHDFWTRWFVVLYYKITIIVERWGGYLMQVKPVLEVFPLYETWYFTSILALSIISLDTNNFITSIFKISPQHHIVKSQTNRHKKDRTIKYWIVLNYFTYIFIKWSVSKFLIFLLDNSPILESFFSFFSFFSLFTLLFTLIK